MKRKGFGIEDTPFMILATVAVMMLVVWIGVSTMSAFVEGNEYQAAVEASTDIYKRAKLLSLGYDGSSDSIRISIPQGYAVRVSDSITTLRLTGFNESNSTELIEPLEIQGVPMVAENETLPSGQHLLNLTYSNGEIFVSWT